MLYVFSVNIAVILKVFSVIIKDVIFIGCIVDLMHIW